MGKRRFTFLRIALLTAILALILVAVCNLWIAGQTRNYIFDNADNVPQTRTGLLISTVDHYDSNTTNQVFENRIRAAVDLHSAGKINRILVSSRRSVIADEPMQIKQALVAQGISDSAIVLDYNTGNIYSRLQHLQRSYNLDSLTIIADNSHASRIVFIGRHLGMTMIAYCSQELPWRYTWKNKVREFFAAARTVADVYILR